MNLHPKKRRFPTRHACLRLAPQVSRNRQQCDGQQEVGQTVEYARAGSHRQSPVYGALFGSLMLKHQAERAAILNLTRNVSCWGPLMTPLFHHQGQQNLIRPYHYLPRTAVAIGIPIGPPRHKPAAVSLSGDHVAAVKAQHVR